MSLSTSSFDATPDASTKTTCLAALIAFLIICASAAFIMVVDPQNARPENWRMKIDRYAEFRSKNVPRWAAFEIERDLRSKQPGIDILLLGDSRMRQLTGGLLESRYATIDDKNIYNLSFGGASIYEQIQFFNNYRDKFPNAHTVIWQVDYHKIREREKSWDRSEEALTAAKHPVFYFTSYARLKESYKWVHKNGFWKHFKSENVEQLPSLGTKITDRCTGEQYLPNQEEIDLYQTYTKRVSSTAVSSVIQTVVQPFIDELKSDGFKVFTYMPPLPMATPQGFSDDFKSAIAATDKMLAPEEHLQIDEQTLKSYSWLDGVHLCPHQALEILPDLLSQIEP